MCTGDDGVELFFSSYVNIVGMYYNMAIFNQLRFELPGSRNDGAILYGGTSITKRCFVGVVVVDLRSQISFLSSSLQTSFPYLVL